MLLDILDNLRISASNDDFDSRRKYERRSMDSCVGIIDGIAYPIKNWSEGGVLMVGDDRHFSVDDTKDITIKFKLSDRIMDVTHAGRILRKAGNRFVLQFSPLTSDVNQKFRKVVEDFVTQEFANSQA